MKSNAKLREYGVTYFFEYNQNNSGGGFDVDDKVTHRLFIEAEDYNKADRIAQGLGVYFDGCDNGMDCECCGDRWYEGREIKFPYVYGLMSKKEADELSKEYDITSRKAEKYKPYNGNTHEIVFNNIEEYARYMAEKWGYDFVKFPDARIFYLNGEVKEFFTKRKQRG
jgi:hypothetical protein